MSEGNLILMGEIFSTEPEEHGGDGTTHRHRMALLIEFDSADDIRAAIARGNCSFSFGRDTTAQGSE